MRKQKALVLGLFSVFALSSLLILQLITPSMVMAGQITSRSLTLVAGTTDAGAKDSGVVKHLFSFTLPTAGAISSISFQYCQLAIGTCVTPTGLSTTSATLGTQTGITFSNINTGSNGDPYVYTNTPITIAPGTNNVITIQLNGVTNPDGTDCGVSTMGNCTFYVRISTYVSSTATGSPIDTGNVAASVVQQIVLSGIMPESLVFCAGGTVLETNSVPDCTTVTTGAVSFNQLFAPTSTAYATSQMAASTNAQTGYVITVNGPTLTSGSSTITPMNVATTAMYGVGQFGLNLVGNTTPAVGTLITPADNGTNYRGQPIPASGYDVANTYKFTTGDAVANSANGGAGATDAQIFTASYIANVPGHQAAGTYTSTLTYICTPEF